MAGSKTVPSPTELLGGKKKSEKPVAKHEEKKKVHGMHLRKLKGGYHVRHHDESDAPIEGAEHLIADTDGLHGHIEEHLGEPNHDEEAEDAATAQRP